MKFEQLKDLMKKRGFYTLADIARELGVSPQAINNWKIRNQVPKKFNFLKDEIEPFNIKSDINSKKRWDEIEHNRNNFITGVDDINQILNEGNLSINEIILVIKGNIKTVILIPFTFFILSLVYLFLFAKPIYTSTAKIIPANSENTMGNMIGIASQFGINVPGNNNNSTKLVYPEIILSRTLAKKMIYKRFDTEEYGQQQSLLKILTYKNEEPKFGVDTMEILAVEKFLSLVSVEDDKKTSIVTVSVDAEEPKLASDIAKKLINELDFHQKKFNTNQAAKKRKFIDERIRDVDEDLIVAEESLKEFRLKNLKYQDSPSLLLEFERILREVEVQKQLYITLKQEFEMAQIEEVEESDILHIIDNPETPLRPSKPRKLIIILFSVFLGFTLAFLVITFKNINLTQK